MRKREGEMERLTDEYVRQEGSKDKWRGVEDRGREGKVKYM